MINNMGLKAVTLQEVERYRLTLEALDDVDNGRLIDHQAVADWVDSLSTEQKLPFGVVVWPLFLANPTTAYNLQLVRSPTLRGVAQPVETINMIKQGDPNVREHFNRAPTK